MASNVANILVSIFTIIAYLFAIANWNQNEQIHSIAIVELNGFESRIVIKFRRLLSANGFNWMEMENFVCEWRQMFGAINRSSWLAANIEEVKHLRKNKRVASTLTANRYHLGHNRNKYTKSTTGYF